MELVFSGTAGIITIVSYGIFILAIGLTAASRHTKSKDKSHDYFLGGRNLGLVVLFFTFLATQYSGNTIIGMAPKAYRLGFAWMQSVSFMILAAAGVLLYAKQLHPLSRKLNLITPADWLDHRFKSPWLSTSATLIMIYALANFILAQLVAMGQAIAGLTSGTIPYQYGIVFFLVIMLVYSWFGGMHSVALVDLFQGITITVGVLIFLIGCFVVFGDLELATQYMLSYEPSKAMLPSLETQGQWLSVLVLFGLAVPLYPMAIQRVFAAKDQSTLKRSLQMMLFAPFIITLPILIIGLIAVPAFPGLAKLESEQLVGIMINQIAMHSKFFYIAMLIFFGAIVSAIVSTADSAILSTSSMISEDIYGKLINSKASDRHKILIGRIATIILVILLLAIAWNPPATLYEILVIKIELLAQTFPAFVLSIYDKKLKAKPVFIGMIAGLALTLFMIVVLKTRTILGCYAGLWGLGTNIACCYVASFILKSKHE